MVALTCRLVALALLAVLALCSGFAAGNRQQVHLDHTFEADGRVVNTFDGNLFYLNDENFDETAHKFHYIFVAFHVEWCKYCRALMPVWKEVAESLNGYKDAALAVIDAVQSPAVAQKYGVNKYPTMKIIRATEMSSSEYRGSRTKEAIKSYFIDQTDGKYNHASSVEEIEGLVAQGDKRVIVGFFSNKYSEERDTFEAVSDHLRDVCRLVEVNDPKIAIKYGVAEGTVIYKTDPDHGLDEVYVSPRDEHDHDKLDNDFLDWAWEKCVPLVKEVTRDNVEATIEEGKPFFMLFYDDAKDDGSSVRTYKNIIENSFKEHGETFNFVYSDGNVFPQPLFHMGLTKSDMPVVVIDTFRHLYRFGNFNCFVITEKVEKFISDFKDQTLFRNLMSGQYHHYECDDELDELSSMKKEIDDSLKTYTEMRDTEEGLKEEEEVLIRSLESFADVTDAHIDQKAAKEQKDKELRSQGIDPSSLEQAIDDRVHESAFVMLKPEGRYTMRDEL